MYCYNAGPPMAIPIYTVHVHVYLDQRIVHSSNHVILHACALAYSMHCMAHPTVQYTENIEH